MKTIMMIDGAALESMVSLYKGQTEKIDYGKMFKWMFNAVKAKVPDSVLRRTYYYHAISDRVHGQTTEASEFIMKRESFFHMLEYLPNVSVVLGQLNRIVKDGNVEFHQKGVDVNLAIDMVSFAHTKIAEHIVLVASDADFVPAVERIKALGISVTLLSTIEKGMMSVNLRRSADEFVELPKECIDSCKM